MHSPRRGPLLLAALAMSIILLVNAAGASHQPRLAVELEVDDGFRFADGRVLVRFNATPEQDAVFHYQLGVAAPERCAPDPGRGEPRQRVLFVSPSAATGAATRGAVPMQGPGDAAGAGPGDRFLSPNCPTGGDAIRITDPRKAGIDPIEWGAVQALAMKAGETARLEAGLGMSGRTDRLVQGLPGDGRLVIRVWQEGSSHAVILGLGDSYKPPEMAVLGNASAAVLENTALLLVGMVHKTQSANGPNQRDPDWVVPLPWPLLWLFTRLKRARLLDHEARQRVYDLVEMEPGIRFVDVQDRTGFASGVLTHHLRMLEDHGFLVSVRRGRQRHLYVEGSTVDRDRGAITERQAEILDLLAEQPSTQAALASRLGLSQQAVSYHLRRLLADDCVTRLRPRGRQWRYALVPAPGSHLA